MDAATATVASPSPSPATSPFSLVSRAKIALHSAAAKAEKVITDIKADLKSDRDADGQSLRGERRSVDHLVASDAAPEFNNESRSSLDENRPSTSPMLTIPPASVIRQLALAIQSGKNLNSVNDLLDSVKDNAPVKEKTGISFSAVKSLVLREKDEKKRSDEEVLSLVSYLFSSDENFSTLETASELEAAGKSNLMKDLHGAPPQSLVVQISQIMGGFKSLQKMASFWYFVIVELRKMWSEDRPLPRMPVDADPDLNCCLLHQQLQVINCSIARKQRRSIAKESLDSFLKEADMNNIRSPSSLSRLPNKDKVYAKTNSGNYALRLGADYPSENLTMLETGEPIYTPITQEGPVLTEDLIKETEDFVLRTGSVGHGCSQLLSDMQAFKAANPGCILEDFVRWYSPPDWMEEDSDLPLTESVDDAEGSSKQGRLSRRMQKKGNLWRELWDSAKPLPAVNQTPLFDEDLAVENILSDLEDIQPLELFEQLFVCALSAGFITAEAALPGDSKLVRLFNECKDYVMLAYQSGKYIEKLDDICKVYETVEAIIVHPEETIRVLEQPDEICTESKGKLKKLGLNFINKEKQMPWRRSRKDENKSDEERPRILSRLLDKKTSLFSKRTKSNTQPCSDELDDTEWTIV